MVNDERIPIDMVDQRDEIERLKAENNGLRKLAEKYVRHAYGQACEKGNPITKGIIMEDACVVGIEADA